MHNLSVMSEQQLSRVKIILTDIDDTLTTDGRLTSAAYGALERLSNSGYKLIPVTGRCAGWCDHIARMWPVDGVVGENGAFFYQYDHIDKTMHNIYSQTELERQSNFKLLHQIKNTVLNTVSGTAVASDQDYRVTDLAIDFAEDVPKLSIDKINEIVEIAENNGATAKVSSIHVNCWIGEHNKLTTSLKILKENFGLNDEEIQRNTIFVGDSPNDSMMFGFFNNSVGVANVVDMMHKIDSPPKYITSKYSGEGFVELADLILKDK